MEETGWKSLKDEIKSYSADLYGIYCSDSI